MFHDLPPLIPKPEPRLIQQAGFLVSTVLLVVCAGILTIAIGGTQ